jgi:putative transposase
MAGEMHIGRRVRLLTMVDHLTRESLAIDVSQRMRGNEVVSVLERLACQRKLLKSVRVDNGPEFRSIVSDQWAYANGEKLHLNGPGKPMVNTFIESISEIV